MRKSSKAISLILSGLLATSCFSMAAISASAAPVDSEATGVDTAATRIANGHQVVFFQFPDTVWGPVSSVKRNARKWTCNVFCNYYSIYGNQNEVKSRSWEAPSTSMLMDKAGSNTLYFDITESGQGEMEEGAEYGILFSTKANAGQADLLQPNTEGYQTCDLYFNTTLLGHTYKVDEPAVVRENTANSQKIDYLAHSDNGVGAPLRKVSTLCAYIDGINPGYAPASLEMANALQTYLTNPVNEPAFVWQKIEPVLAKFGTTNQEVYDLYVEKFVSKLAEGVPYEHVDGESDQKADGSLKDVYRYSSITTTTVDEDGVEQTKVDKYPWLDLVRERLNLPIEASACSHRKIQTIKGYPATCTEAGLTDSLRCSECDKIFTEQRVIPAKGHTVVRDNAKAPTCTETGFTEGSYCSACGKIFQAQEEIPALGHHPIIDPYLAPTCSHDGHTIGSYCDRCGEVYVAGEVIPKLAHTIIKDEAVAPSCGHTGLTEGSHCSVCGEVITAQQTIPALSHSYEIVPAVPPTYTKDGKTDGVRCKLCGEWLIEPQTIPKKEIDFVIGDLDGDDRLTIHDATVLQQFLAEFATLDLNDEKTFLKADVNGDGKVNVRDVTAIQRKLAEITP